MKYYLTWNDSKQIKVMHCHHDALDQFKTEQNPLFIRWLKAEEVSAANNIYGGGRPGGPRITKTPKFTWNPLADLAEEKPQYPNPPKNKKIFVSTSRTSDGNLYVSSDSSTWGLGSPAYQNSSVTTTTTATWSSGA